MNWFCEPPTWRLDGDTLSVTTAAQSDFWRRTHYGFIRDNGHFYYEEVSGDFVAYVQVRGDYRTLYDQAGLMVRADEENWLKCGVEYVDGVQNLSVVVTRSYSDWSVMPLSEPPPAVWVRVTRIDTALEIHGSLDGDRYELLRVTYLPLVERVQVGPMAASPGEGSFAVRFTGFTVHPRT